MLGGFMGHLTANPNLARIISKQVNQRNAWILATSMQHHDVDDRKAILEETLLTYPESQQAKKRQHLVHAIEITVDVVEEWQVQQPLSVAEPAVVDHRVEGVLLGGHPSARGMRSNRVIE